MQFSVSRAQCVFTHFAGFGLCGGGLRPGVRGPRALQVQSCQLWASSSHMPFSQLGLHMANESFFSKHVSPPPLQHFVSLQLSEESEHVWFTHLAAGSTRAMPGVRWPICLQSHGLSSSKSVTSMPAVQSGLHRAVSLFFLKQMNPASLQHLDLPQSSVLLEHRFATQGAAVGQTAGSGHFPGVLLPSSLQLQGLGSGSAGSGPGTHSCLHIAQASFPVFFS
mmetsp:Transcript_89696/g.249142  ORF Transcript_89696/g.249142 Transcript_89696/m.249142 type:complete len:222 (+) Transcript_89696:129-794(+)